VGIGGEKRWVNSCFLVPLIGGIGTKKNHPIGRKNATYIPLIVLAYWVLREPETAIDWGGLVGMVFSSNQKYTPGRINMEPEKDRFC